MVGHTRRSVLGALGAVAATGVVGARTQTSPERLLTVSGQRVPENIAVDADGNLYIGLTAGAVYRLPAERTGETDLTLADAERLARYPGGVAGVETVDGLVYAAVTAGPNPSTGIHAVRPGRGSRTQVVEMPLAGYGFLNDMAHDGENDRLLVSESFGGNLYEVSLSNPRFRRWTGSDLLDTASFGANGLAILDGDCYVSVTRAEGGGRIVRIPVDSDGNAGEAETLVEGQSVAGADGLTAHDGALYPALNAQNRIARVTTDGSVSTVVEGSPLSFPSEAVFDPTTEGRMFVCNFSNSAPEQGGVLRLDLNGDDTM